jgi:hypothetical protein
MSLTKTESVVKEKPTVGSQFFRAFPSDRILIAMKEVIMPQVLYKKLFEATTYSE